MPDDTPQPDADAERLAKVRRQHERHDQECDVCWLLCLFDDVQRGMRNELISRAAALRERDAGIERLREACAEAYQVVGVLADHGGVFETKDVEHALDNLFAAADGKPIPHTDLLPFPKAPFVPSPPQSDIERAHAIIDKAYQEGKAKAESCGAEYGWSDDAIRMATESIRYEFLGNVVAAALSAARAEGERIGEARGYARGVEDAAKLLANRAVVFAARHDSIFNGLIMHDELKANERKIRALSPEPREVKP